MTNASKFIDTHSHLAFSDFDDDRDDVIKRAWESGFEAVLIIGSGEGVDGNFRAIELAEKDEKLFATVGIHPNDASDIDLDMAVKKLRKLASNKKVVAIGEIGLDFYRDHAEKEDQEKCFKRFLDLAFELKLPVSIHNRSADKEILHMLMESRYELTGGVFHCFSGDIEMAHEIIDLGFYIGIPGIITFKNADKLKEVVANIPVERIVLETDAPYLAPEPFRGKRNEPLYVKYIADEIAKIKKLSPRDVVRITTINAKRAFNLPGFKPVGKLVYPIRNSLYINLTNRCTLACTFCPKHSGSFEVKGHDLELTQEPDIEEVWREMKDIKKYDEVVFCGFGEPSLRIELLKVIAKRVKDKGTKVRLDTDGLMNLVHKRDVLPELTGLIDEVSVSMNASNPKTYAKICPSRYGEEAFYAVLSFLGRAKEFIPEVTATAIDMPSVDIKACEKLAGEIGVNFRKRIYQEVG